MAYDIDFSKADEIKAHKRSFLLYPNDWEEKDFHIKIRLKWNSIKFKEENKDEIPDSKGVYCFVLKPYIPEFIETRYLFYIGQTTRTLRKRFYEYLNEFKGVGKVRNKIYNLLNRYNEYIYFYYTVINDEDQIKIVENKLLNALVPPVNSEIPKAQVKPEYKNIYEN